MKVLIFTENNRGGGMDTFIVNLINYWPNKEDNFLIICNSNHPGIQYIDKNLNNKCKIITHNMPLNWSFLSFIIKYFPDIVQRIFRQVFRIVLSPYQYWSLKKIFINENADQLISVNGAYPGGETCRLANIAWRAIGNKNSLHNLHNFAIKPRVIFSIYENYIDKQLERSCKHIIGVSKYCSNTLRKRKTFKNSNKIMSIYNGLNIESNKISNNKSLRDLLKINKQEKLILMLGTYEKRKGHEYLLEAMSYVYKKHPETQLAILGTGTKKEEENIRSYVTKYAPNKKIHLPGFIENAGFMLSEADIIAIPSQEFESFGLTAIEAMLNGVPVISTDAGGLPETIGVNGECGFYCSHKKPKEFSEKILYLIENKDKSIEIGRNGKIRANKLFNAQKMAKKYHDLLVSTK